MNIFEYWSIKQNSDTISASTPLSKQNLRAGTSLWSQPTFLTYNVDWLVMDPPTPVDDVCKSPSTIIIKGRAQPQIINAFKVKVSVLLVLFNSVFRILARRRSIVKAIFSLSFSRDFVNFIDKSSCSNSNLQLNDFFKERRTSTERRIWRSETGDYQKFWPLFGRAKFDYYALTLT